MHTSAARTALECTRKICRDSVHAFRHAASACRVLFLRAYTRFARLGDSRAKGNRVDTSENSQPAILLPKGLKGLKRVAKRTGLVLKGAYLNLDGGFDSKHNRKAIFNAGLIPNVKENPRNRKRSKRGRKRWFNAAIHALRERIERTFAWEDKFKRLLLRFEYIQQRHYGMKLLAYTLINVRRFCRA
jgi:hypothetical protein